MGVIPQNMNENGGEVAEIIQFQWRYFLQASPVTYKAHIDTRRITFDWLKFLWQVDVIIDEDFTINLYTRTKI